jgi:hypothetical protein
LEHARMVLFATFANEAGTVSRRPSIRYIVAVLPSVPFSLPPEIFNVIQFAVELWIIKNYVFMALNGLFDLRLLCCKIWLQRKKSAGATV